MASSADFIQFVCEQIGAAGLVSSKKMFGEYAVYLEGKVVALVCDNRLFVKPTVAGRAHLGAVTEAPPYPGAKPHFLIEEQLERRQFMAKLIRLSAAELPSPARKKQKPRKPMKN